MNYRRPVLRVPVAVAVLAAVLTIDVAPASAVRSPETLAHSVPVGEAPVRPGFVPDFVAVTWDGEHGEALVRFERSGGWTPWQEMGEDGAVEEGRFGSTLVPADEASAYQVRVPAGVTNARSVAINTTDGPLVTVGRQAASTAGAGDPVDFVLRGEWGADESLRFDSSGNEIWPKTHHPVQKLTVHHTATENDDPDPAATVRAIYRYHAVERGWGDIGYQYLVDESGNVYEGRHTDDDSSTYPGYIGDEGVVGAHVGSWNSGNLGVSMLGTLTDRRPTAGAQRGVERVVAELAQRSGIDPLGSSTYVNPVNGETWTGPNVPGHRDFAATECPGGAAYELLPTVRQRIADRIAGTLVEDDTAPTVSSVGANSVTQTSAKVAWATVGDSSDSQVQYWVKGRPSSVSTTPLDLRFVETHEVALSSLRRRTTYQYRVLSADEAGNQTVSEVYCFTTAR